ncbi:MAG: enolase C-terminal domain-like protein [Verrucomicrobiota bacterium]
MKGLSRISYKFFDLEMRNSWSIASRMGAGGRGLDFTRTVFVKLEDASGHLGIGEASPVPYYGESPETLARFFEKIDPAVLSFEDPLMSDSAIQSIGDGNHAAKCALTTALWDGAAKHRNMSLSSILQLSDEPTQLESSFTIGLDVPEMIEKKTREASEHGLLKLKVGLDDDFKNLEALRKSAPQKRLRLDANEAWKTPESALRKIEQFAEDPYIGCVEQALPRTASAQDKAWLKQRSPLPLMADESYLSEKDSDEIDRFFDWVNVKLVKTGGPYQAVRALKAAKAAKLKTMIGCMIESSFLISCAAHLMSLADTLDLDGAALSRNDPFAGAQFANGTLNRATLAPSNGVGAIPVHPDFLSTGWHLCG